MCRLFSDTAADIARSVKLTCTAGVGGGNDPVGYPTYLNADEPISGARVAAALLTGWIVFPCRWRLGAHRVEG